MNRYICGYCGLTHAEGTKTIARHAKKYFPKWFSPLKIPKMKEPFKLWMFYWLVWEKDFIDPDSGIDRDITNVPNDDNEESI